MRSCRTCGNKIYLDVLACVTREELRRRIGDSFQVTCNHCGHTDTYYVREVYAEEGVSSVPAGTIVGGLIGLVGGPLGMIIGGALGMLLGANTDEMERRNVENFNES